MVPKELITTILEGRRPRSHDVRLGNKGGSKIQLEACSRNVFYNLVTWLLVILTVHVDSYAPPSPENPQKGAITCVIDSNRVFVCLIWRREKGQEYEAKMKAVAGDNPFLKKLQSSVSCSILLTLSTGKFRQVDGPLIDKATWS
ncbi:hypothetical protein RND71_026139 [Anisodus tanguticus]|uniref:Uncharacterized protein n=1 Tax=Anisodus tanguticus TaxID=243964 RepID=A0AAE1RKC6_9SOLA|nr:hypothetical protein RND71_026139 [Anisodus tanguticus]